MTYRQNSNLEGWNTYLFYISTIRLPSDLKVQVNLWIFVGLYSISFTASCTRGDSKMKHECFSNGMKDVRPYKWSGNGFDIKWKKGKTVGFCLFIKAHVFLWWSHFMRKQVERGNASRKKATQVHRFGFFTRMVPTDLLLTAPYQREKFSACVNTWDNQSSKQLISRAVSQKRGITFASRVT